MKSTKGMVWNVTNNTNNPRVSVWPVVRAGSWSAPDTGDMGTLGAPGSGKLSHLMLHGPHVTFTGSEILMEPL